MRDMLLNGLDGEGRPPLTYGVVCNKVATVKYLISRGAEVNAADEQGHTILHWAAYHQVPKVLTVLLKNGANPLAVDSEGRTALHLCSRGSPCRGLTRVAPTHRSCRVMYQTSRF